MTSWHLGIEDISNSRDILIEIFDNGVKIYNIKKNGVADIYISDSMDDIDFYEVV